MVCTVVYNHVHKALSVPTGLVPVPRRQQGPASMLKTLNVRVINIILTMYQGRGKTPNEKQDCDSGLAIQAYYIKDFQPFLYYRILKSHTNSAHRLPQLPQSPAALGTTHRNM